MAGYAFGSNPPYGLPRSSVDSIYLLRLILRQCEKGQRASCALDGIFNLAFFPVKWRRPNKQGEISLDERGGYDEAEALIIAKYQARAVLCRLVGWLLVIVLAANIVEPWPRAG